MACYSLAHTQVEVKGVVRGHPHANVGCIIIDSEHHVHMPAVAVKSPLGLAN